MTFVGSLFETSGSRTTKFIFLGDQRVAAVTNSPTLGTEVLYYHADHLGGANVLTDGTGFKKELIEYEPFGLESRHEKYGSSEEVAWYYFTGKKTDDESGLIYFGARYYDPSLGRFITPDTIVPYPSDPQSFNRYSYARNNPVNVIDPTGHKWSWKKFWNAFAGAVVGAIVTVATGGLGAPIAFALGGMVGGAITGGLEGGVNGALMGAAMGGVLGGGVGLGIGAFGPAFGIGALVAGAGVAGATGNWDSFAGGLAGGLAGTALGNGLVKSQQWQNMRAGKGFRTNRDVQTAQWDKYSEQQRALNVNKADKIKVDVVSRYLKDPDSDMSGTMATFRHRGIRGDGIGFDMGPEKGRITIATNESSNFDTFLRTSEYLADYPQAVKIATVEVSQSGLSNMIQEYGKVWGGDQYLFYNHNSNYAVDTIIYGAGGDVPNSLGWTFQGK